MLILLQKIQKMANKDMTFGYHPVGAPTCLRKQDMGKKLVMGDSGKKKTIRFDSIQCHKRVDSIQFDSIRFTAPSL